MCNESILIVIILILICLYALQCNANSKNGFCGVHMPNFIWLIIFGLLIAIETRYKGISTTFTGGENRKRSTYRDIEHAVYPTEEKKKYDEDFMIKARIEILKKMLKYNKNINVERVIIQYFNELKEIHGASGENVYGKLIDAMKDDVTLNPAYLKIKPLIDNENYDKNYTQIVIIFLTEMGVTGKSDRKNIIEDDSLMEMHFDILRGISMDKNMEHVHRIIAVYEYYYYIYGLHKSTVFMNLLNEKYESRKKESSYVKPGFLQSKKKFDSFVERILLAYRVVTEIKGLDKFDTYTHRKGGVLRKEIDFAWFSRIITETEWIDEFNKRNPGSTMSIY